MNKSILLSTLVAQVAAGADGIADTGVAFNAAHVIRNGTVRVEAVPEQAFQLFTAPGERLWAPGWDPAVLSGGDGRQKGSVWVTTLGHETTIWLVVDFDDQALHARYARISPGRRAGTVEVQVRGDGRGGSVAEVTYELTALSEAGNRNLAEFGQQQFAQMMTEWEDAIRTTEIDYAGLMGR